MKTREKWRFLGIRCVATSRKMSFCFASSLTSQDKSSCERLLAQTRNQQISFRFLAALRIFFSGIKSQLKSERLVISAKVQWEESKSQNTRKAHLIVGFIQIQFIKKRVLINLSMTSRDIRPAELAKMDLRLFKTSFIGSSSCFVSFRSFIKVF